VTGTAPLCLMCQKRPTLLPAPVCALCMARLDLTGRDVREQLPPRRPRPLKSN
jgi:predicted amidophosphoribosyltransferase